MFGNARAVAGSKCGIGCGAAERQRDGNEATKSAHVASLS